MSAPTPGDMAEAFHFLSLAVPAGMAVFAAVFFCCVNRRARRRR